MPKVNQRPLTRARRSAAEIGVLLGLLLAGAACSKSADTGTQSAGTSGFTLPGAKDGFGGGLGSDVQAPKPDTTAAADEEQAQEDSATEEVAGTDQDAAADPDAQGEDAGAADAEGTDTEGADVEGSDAEGSDAEEPDTAGDPDSGEPACQVDDDNDDYGLGCPNGDDCDDMNPNFTVSCPDCSKPGTAGCLCKASDKPVSCYSGNQEWLGKGICIQGAHQCKNGFWSGCLGEVMPEPEKCDSKDNDCDGETDEGVKSTCGTCDLTCNEQKIGAASPLKWNLNSENATGLGLDPQGNVILDASQISLNLKFIWIANSPQSTVSKLDCKTGKEVGRFTVCPDPSRTSVDLDGNVWVACRGNGAVAKIMAEAKNCVDKNGNGTIETSTNSSPVGNDECIKFIVQPNQGSYARAAGVDKDNHVWIGYYNNKTLVRLEPVNGQTVETVALGCSPYGLVIDQKGIVWLQGLGCGLVRYDPVTKKLDTGNNLPSLKYPSGAYGINVDKYGRIWVASGNSTSAFDPKTMTWQVVKLANGGGRGLATSNDGYVYPALDSYGGAAKINGNVDPPVVEGYIKGGGSPVGAALDYDGYVWVVNQGGSSASKLDPKTMTLIGTYPVGSSPYTYSDMTGYTLNYFTAPKGQYSTVFFGGLTYNPVTTNQPKQVWQTITAEADLPEGTALRIRLRAGNTKAELEAAKWSEPIDFPPAVFPYNVATLGIVGNLLQVEVGLTTKDKKVTPVLKSLSAKSKLM
jgi:streptogramin lyase